MSLARLELDGDDEWPVVRLSGQIDLSNAAVLSTRAESAVTNRARGLVLDLSHVTYLDSTGLQLIFRLARRLGDRQQALRLVVPATSRIRRLLTMSGVGAVAEVSDPDVPSPSREGCA